MSVSTEPPLRYETYSSIAAAPPYIESGNVRPIAATSLSRVSMMPDVWTRVVREAKLEAN